MGQLVSVICTVKNGEHTIEKTINSVINQSYDNWELIIVDDGSIDRTPTILKSFETKYDMIRVFYSEGVGRGKALNKAIELTRGSLIANIDADDLMHPKRLEYQVNIMREKEVFLVCTGSELIYESEEPVWETINIQKSNVTKIDKKLLVRNRINHSSVLMNKDDLEKLGGYDENRKGQLDYDLWLKAFLQNKEMWKINSKLTAKRIHENQSFENKKRLRYTFNSSLLQLKYILKSKRYTYFIPLPIISFILGQLPFRYRRMISRKLLGEK